MDKCRDHAGRCPGLAGSGYYGEKQAKKMGVYAYRLATQKLELASEYGEELLTGVITRS